MLATALSAAIVGVDGVPEVVAGDAIGEMIAQRAGLGDGDIVVVSQKVVSKAEGRVLALETVEPGEEATRLAAELGKDPRIVELVLTESQDVLRAERGVLITRTKHGFVCANAGIDTSNLPTADSVSLLPVDADASARRIRSEIVAVAHATVAVVISDSFGRAWRLGQSEVAIGCAGLVTLDDWRGRTDAGGVELEATMIAIADEAAAAADLVRDKASATPASVVRGLSRYVTEEDGPGAAALLRPEGEDLFL